MLSGKSDYVHCHSLMMNTSRRSKPPTCSHHSVALKADGAQREYEDRVNEADRALLARAAASEGNAGLLSKETKWSDGTDVSGRRAMKMDNKKLTSDDYRNLAAIIATKVEAVLKARSMAPPLVIHATGADDDLIVDSSCDENG